MLNKINTDLGLELTEIYTFDGIASENEADFKLEDFLSGLYISGKTWFIWVIKDNKTISYQL
jgi:hypothetical protein